MFAGWFTSALTDTSPFAATYPPMSLSVNDFMLMGALVGIVFAVSIALVHIFFFRYDARTLLALSLLIGIVVGALGGLIANILVTNWLSALVAMIVGAFVGALLCWALCRRDKRAVEKVNDIIDNIVDDIKEHG